MFQSGQAEARYEASRPGFRSAEVRSAGYFGCKAAELHVFYSGEWIESRE